MLIHLGAKCFIGATKTIHLRRNLFAEVNTVEQHEGGLTAGISGEQVAAGGKFNAQQIL